MNRLILSTGSDINYLGKIQPYLNSISTHSNFDENILVFLNDSEIKLNNEKINVAHLSPSHIEVPNQNNCIQHGEFLKSNYFNKFNDNDVIFFTDGDIIIQRNLTEEEENERRGLVDADFKDAVTMPAKSGRESGSVLVKFVLRLGSVGKYITALNIQFLR